MCKYELEREWRGEKHTEMGVGVPTCLEGCIVSGSLIYWSDCYIYGVPCLFTTSSSAFLFPLLIPSTWLLSLMVVLCMLLLPPGSPSCIVPSEGEMSGKI